MYSVTSDVQVYGVTGLLVHPLVIWNLALIHLERYLSIVHPLRCDSFLKNNLFFTQILPRAVSIKSRLC